MLLLDKARNAMQIKKIFVPLYHKSEGNNSLLWCGRGKRRKKHSTFFLSESQLSHFLLLLWISGLDYYPSPPLLPYHKVLKKRAEREEREQQKKMFFFVKWLSTSTSARHSFFQIAWSRHRGKKDMSLNTNPVMLFISPFLPLSAPGICRDASLYTYPWHVVQPPLQQAVSFLKVIYLSSHSAFSPHSPHPNPQKKQVVSCPLLSLPFPPLPSTHP